MRSVKVIPLRALAAIGKPQAASAVRSGDALPVSLSPVSRLLCAALALGAVFLPAAAAARVVDAPGLIVDYSVAGAPTAAYAPGPDGQGGPAEPDRAGLRRDTKYVLSLQFFSLGVLYIAPESISNWDEEQKEEYSLSKWWQNVQNPQWDDDQHWINYLAHPYWGAAYYVRARENGFDERASFWYSVAMSTAYEFGAEALFEQPSIQDLVVTPVGGVIVGEYFMSLRARTLERYPPGAELAFGDRALLALTDPLGAINRQVQSWLGVGDEASVLPYFEAQRLGERKPYAEDTVGTDWVYGLRFNYRW